ERPTFAGVTSQEEDSPVFQRDPMGKCSRHIRTGGGPPRIARRFVNLGLGGRTVGSSDEAADDHHRSVGQLHTHALLSRLEGRGSFPATGIRIINLGTAAGCADEEYLTLGQRE